MIEILRYFIKLNFSILIYVLILFEFQIAMLVHQK